jgi:hypothetical protein
LHWLRGKCRDSAGEIQLRRKRRVGTDLDTQAYIGAQVQEAENIDNEIRDVHAEIDNVPGFVVLQAGETARRSMVASTTVGGDERNENGRERR